MAKGKTPLKPPTAAGGRGPAGKKHRPAWHRLLQWAKANPGATLAAALSVAFVVVISVWAPLTPNQFARRWYENGGAITHCNKALAIAKGRSELRCWQKTALPDGSVNRGLFGLNTFNHSSVPDACAFDCECSLKEVILLSHAGPKVWDHYANNTGVDIEAMIEGTSTPCNEIAEKMIKDGFSMLSIQGDL